MSRAALRSSTFLFAGAICLANGWVRHVNKISGYTLDYPASWYPLDKAANRFDILNFPPEQRIKGVVLKDKGAEIIATLQPKESRSLEDWIKLDLSHNQLIDSRDISEALKSHEGCDRLLQVVSRSEVAEGNYFIYTSLYCVTNRRSLEVTLTNWEGDPDQHEYQAIAVRIAESARGL